MTNPEHPPKKSRRSKKRSRQALLEELEIKRREAAARFLDLRRSAERELGSLAPRKRLFAIPVVAFACGLAVAMALRRKR